jgi:hypothetical protein
MTAARAGNEARVTIRARASALALLAAVACAATLLAPRAPAGAAPPRDACADAQAYQRTAASPAVSRQAAYDSAVAGLAINQSCANAQQRLVNEAYLLSVRAAAAHDLNVGDWRRDLGRANALLAQCAAAPGLARTKAAGGCRTQLQYNRSYEAALTVSASPAPASPVPTSPSPRPPG